jgi:hypothetical protein
VQAEAEAVHLAQLVITVVLGAVADKLMHNLELQPVDQAILLVQIPAKVILVGPDNEPTLMTIMLVVEVVLVQWAVMQHLVRPEQAEQEHYLR